MSTGPTDEAKNEAFNLIHDLAANLLNSEDSLSPQARKDLDLIIALARYQANILIGADRERVEQVKHGSV